MASTISSALYKALCGAALLSCSVIISAQGARPQRTTMRGLKVKPLPPAARDTLHAHTGAVTLSGYEKPLRSSTETMLVTSLLDSATVAEINVRLDYTDTQGRMLHSREVTLTVDIPPGETRQAAFPSWDRQHTYYYRLNQAPQRAQGTPFDVKATPLWIILKTESNDTK